MLYLALLSTLIGIIKVQGCAVDAILTCACTEGGTECSTLQTNAQNMMNLFSPGSTAPTLACDTGTAICTAGCSTNTDCGDVISTLDGMGYTDDRTECIDGLCKVPPTVEVTESPGATEAATEAPKVTEAGETEAPVVTEAGVTEAPGVTEAAGDECVLDTGDLINSLKACTCSAEEQTHCTDLETDYGAQVRTVFAGEEIRCDTSNGHCSLSCNSATTCPGISMMSSGAVNPTCVDGVCQEAVTGGEPSDDTTTSTPEDTSGGDEGTTEEPGCDTLPSLPVPACFDCEGGDGCRIEVELSVDICNLDLQVPVAKLKQIISKTVKQIVDDIEDKDIACDDTDIEVCALEITLKKGDITAVTNNAQHIPGADACPSVDVVCDETNLQIDTKVSLRCGSCDELYRLALKLLGKVTDGTLGSKFDQDSLALSEVNDAVCGIGFGEVSVQGEAKVTVYKANGDEYFSTDIDINQNNGLRRGCYGVMVVVMVALSLFY